ncbi:transposase [Siculibacillus lacustris]|uniref:Transposase n=1 Tax=Siculibacillus lacustris TaxID=1549641 RepID=A0A4Q9VCN9_9HYPH|nr:transposase [Siculibacillus lacustris]TBW32286.1 transposase [Siculibacillus lacustris]
MPNYRRLRIPGGCWFFTVALQDRRSGLLVERIADLRAAVAVAHRRQPFQIDAMVVLPDHLHAVWTLPDGDSDFSERWRRIKAEFTSALVAAGIAVPKGRRPGERALWQRRFWEHAIRDDADFARHFDYCHINPMKHGLVDRVADWPHSSFHRAVRDGVYAADWAGTVEGPGDFGER